MWLIILLIPVILITLLMFLKVRLCLIYDGELLVKVKVLFINIPIIPKTEKKPKPKDYTIKALQKKQAKADKKTLKKQKKQDKKEKKKNSADTSQQPKDKGEKLKEILELIKLILNYVMSPFGRYLKVEILDMHIKIGNDDPSKTAFLYGTVCQSVAYIVELLSNITNVDVKRKNTITVEPDFFQGKTAANINITLGLRVWHALSLAIKFFMGYITARNAKQAEKAAENITPTTASNV